MKKKYLLISFVILIAACGKDSGMMQQETRRANTDSDALQFVPILEHTALPTQTDPSITTATFGSRLQYAYIPEKPANRKNKLFIFIPGTSATCVNYRKILQTGAQTGFYTIGLSYDNQQTIETYVGTTDDDSKAENIFEEYLTGANTSPVVNVPRANSFENRIIKMVRYLDSIYPAEKWKQFLTTDNQIKWNMISLAGHSQGADHTMYISKKRNLLRAGFFSGPYHFRLANGQYPSFIANTAITPVANIYGFNHTGDLIRNWTDEQLNWTELNMIGIPQYVDGVTHYNGDTHKLITKEDLKNFTTYHGAPVSDHDTPLDSTGIPLFKKVWIYMCFPK